MARISNEWKEQLVLINKGQAIKLIKSIEHMNTNIKDNHTVNNYVLDISYYIVFHGMKYEDASYTALKERVNSLQHIIYKLGG